MATTDKGGGKSSGKKSNRKGASGSRVRESVMNHESLVVLEAKERSFALAVAVIQDRIRTLRPVDRSDLMEVIPYLFCDDPEEVRAAQKAVDVILLDERKVHLIADSALPSPQKAMSEWLSYISEKIRSARASAGLTQEELANKSGLPQSHISRLENGVHSPSNKTLEKIAEALGISLGNLDPGQSRSKESER
jgi:DNA-binding XRE family transcriptional regulator